MRGNAMWKVIPGVMALAMLSLMGCGRSQTPASAPSEPGIATPNGAASSTTTDTTPPEVDPDVQQALSGAISTFLADNDDPTVSTPVKSSLIDLNDDEILDALVLLVSSNWCGSGGCTLLVFEGQKEGLQTVEPGDEFRLVSQSTLIQEPLIVSENRTQGWRDLVVEVSGGGAKPAQVALQFDGQAYPENPSILDPLPPGTSVQGVTVLSADEAPRAVSDKATLEATCREAVAGKYGLAGGDVTLQFGRTDEGGSAYGYTLPDGKTGTCRVLDNGTIDYLEESP